MFKANLIGFGLAVGSSAFIGSSFIIKKKGLQRAEASGSRASKFYFVRACVFDVCFVIFYVKYEFEVGCP